MGDQATGLVWSRSANPAYAWYVNTEGGRIFFGDKGRSYYVWLVRGESQVLPVTGGPETSSGYDHDWAMALYLDKGGVGVGMKKNAHYHAWLVSDQNGMDQHRLLA